MNDRKMIECGYPPCKNTFEAKSVRGRPKKYCCHSCGKKTSKMKPSLMIKETYTRMLHRTKDTYFRNKKYFGLPIMPREEFLEWANNDEQFKTCYWLWEGSNYNKTMKPSIDRIDSSKGYVKGNVQWLPLCANVGKERARKVFAYAPDGRMKYQLHAANAGSIYGYNPNIINESCRMRNNRTTNFYEGLYWSYTEERNPEKAKELFINKPKKRKKK